MGGFAGAFSGAVMEPGLSYGSLGQDVLSATIASVVGGGVSLLSGGSFANGAWSAAFQQMFNAALHGAAYEIDKQIHTVYLVDKSGPPRQGRHACNFFVEDGAAKVGVKNFPQGTASQIVVKLQEDGHEVTEVQAVNEAASGKYLVVAGETAAELGQGQGQGHVLILLGGWGSSFKWHSNQVPMGASISDSTNPNNTATFYDEPISYAFTKNVASRIEYFAIPISGGG